MDEEKFEAAERQAREIKERYVDRNRKWYAKHQYIPFLLFRIAGIITIIFSVALPAVSALNDFAHRQVVIAFMSITIAGLTGRSTFFRWERSWRGRNLSMSATDALVEKWELELLNARLVLTESAGPPEACLLGDQRPHNQFPRDFVVGDRRFFRLDGLSAIE